MSESTDNRKSDVMRGSGVALYGLGLRIKGLESVHTRALSLIDLKPGEVLLDVGCGTGRVLRALRTKYPQNEFMGIDASEDMLARARRESAPNIRYKIAYADDLPTPNASIDFVSSILMAHHLPEAEKAKMIGEMRRVLKPGGKVLFSDLGRPKNLWGRLLAFISSGHSYTKGNMEIIERELVNNHFRIIKKEVQFGYIEHVLAQKL